MKLKIKVTNGELQTILAYATNRLHPLDVDRWHRIAAELKRAAVAKGGVPPK